MVTINTTSEHVGTLLDLQQAFLDLRFGMFLHYNMATFQNLEWGNPREPISVFNPSALDTDQWISAAKAAGMTYACLTTKVSLWLHDANRRLISIGNE